MDGVKNALLNLASELQKAALPLGILAFAIVGVVLVIGSKRMRDGVQDRIYGIIIGIAITVGSVSIGTWAYNIFTF